MPPGPLLQLTPTGRAFGDHRNVEESREGRRDIRSEAEKLATKKKLLLMSGLFEFAMKVKSHQLKRQNPELDEAVIRKMAYALIEKGCK